MKRKEVLAYISTIDGWLSSHEGFFLYEAARSINSGKTKKGNIVEIGSWLGKSTICLASGSKEGSKSNVFAIDPHKGEFTKGNGIGKKAPTFKEFQQNLKKTGVASLVKPLVTTSKKAATSWKGSIQLLFIDGLHDYKNSKLDYSLWSPFVAENGMIAFHDAFCGHIGPEKIIRDEILSSDNWHDIGVVGSIIYAKKGTAKTLLQRLDILRTKFFISLALSLNKKEIFAPIKFFLIHRVIKTFLLNTYTMQLKLENE